jgi:hypothetical protein
MQSPSKQTNGNGRAGQGRGKYGRGEEALALTLRYVNADSFGGKGFCGFMSGCVVSSLFLPRISRRAIGLFAGALGRNTVAQCVAVRYHSSGYSRIIIIINIFYSIEETV